MDEVRARGVGAGGGGAARTEFVPWVPMAADGRWRQSSCDWCGPLFTVPEA